MLGWFMSEGGTPSRGEENPSVVATPAAAGDDTTAEERSASPALRRSLRKRKERSLEPPENRVTRPTRKSRMAPVRTPTKGQPSPGVAAQAPVGASAVKPAQLVINTGPIPSPLTAPLPSNAFPFTPGPPVVPPVEGQQSASDARMEALLVGMEYRLGGKIDGMDARMKAVEKKMKEDDEGMEDRITGIVQRELRNSGLTCTAPGLQNSTLSTQADPSDLSQRLHLLAGGAAPGAGGRDGRREQQYWEHRRALRIWPVQGPDLQAGLKAFLTDKLGFTEQDVKDMSPFNVTKHMDPRSKATNEVVVHFPNSGVTDTVKAAAPRLAPLGRAAGIRLHIPGYLLNNFKLLENLGYRMRTVNADVRRVIKFDDENLGLVMDVKVDGTWRRVRPADALAAKNAIGETVGLSSGPTPMSGSHIQDFFTNPPPAATGANATPMGQP